MALEPRVRQWGGTTMCVQGRLFCPLLLDRPGAGIIREHLANSQQAGQFARGLLDRTLIELEARFFSRSWQKERTGGESVVWVKSLAS